MSFEFRINKSDTVKDVVIIKPSQFSDLRGNIWTSFNSSLTDQIFPEGLMFMHDKFSRSTRNVIRGIHFDDKSWKLVTCVYGCIIQIVADLRPTSKTFLKHQKFLIDSSEPTLVLLPPGIGNGYCVLSDEAVYHYKLAYEGEYADADKQYTVIWNDPTLSIEWPVKEPILSVRDTNASSLSDYLTSKVNL